MLFSSVDLKGLHSSMNSEKDPVWIVILLKRAKMTQRYTHSGFLPVAECQMSQPCAANYSSLRPQQQNSSTALCSHQQQHSQFSFLEHISVAFFNVRCMHNDLNKHHCVAGTEWVPL